MDQASYLEELISEYLLFRGFVKSFTSFSQDRLSDRTSNPEPELLSQLILDQIQRLEYNEFYELWDSLESKFFTHLPIQFQSAIQLLLNDLRAAFLIKAVKLGNQAKINEFFEKFSTDILDGNNTAMINNNNTSPTLLSNNISSSFDYFSLPYIKDPSSHPRFALYFSRPWFHSLTISLKNFLTTVFQRIPLPKLLAYNLERAERKQIGLEIRILRQENNSLKKELIAAREKISAMKIRPITELNSIAATANNNNALSSIPSPSNNNSAAAAANAVSSSLSSSVLLSNLPAAVNRIRFSPSGSRIATASLDGSIRVFDLVKWLETRDSAPPSPVSRSARSISESNSPTNSPGHSSDSSSSSLSLTPIFTHSLLNSSVPLSFAWDSKNFGFLAFGSNDGKIKFVNVESRKIKSEMEIAKEFSAVIDIALSPTDKWLISSSATAKGSQSPLGGKGLLEQWDLTTARRSMAFNLNDSPTSQINRIAFNHNGSLLVAGGSDGFIRVFDMAANHPILSWSAHTSAVADLKFSADETSIFSLGLDGKFIEFSLYKSGKIIRKFDLPAVAEWADEKPMRMPEFAIDGNCKRFAITGCGSSAAEAWIFDGSHESKYWGNVIGHSAPLLSLDWHPSLNLLATGSADQAARIHWINKDFEENWSIPTPTSSSAAANHSSISVGGGNGKIQIQTNEISSSKISSSDISEMEAIVIDDRTLFTPERSNSGAGSSQSSSSNSNPNSSTNSSSVSNSNSNSKSSFGFFKKGK